VTSTDFALAADGKLTKDVWMSQCNEDTKAAWFEILGPGKVMQVLGGEQIDSCTTIHVNGEMEEHILYKTPFSLPELGEPLAWVKFVCPSTAASYLISVNPKYDNVKDAVLSTCPFNGSDIKSFDEYQFSARG
jgi:hypothetical protein